MWVIGASAAAARSVSQVPQKADGIAAARQTVDRCHNPTWFLGAWLADLSRHGVGDPGWYNHPDGTVARPATTAELKADGILVE